MASLGETVTLMCSGRGEAPVSASWVTPAGQTHSATGGDSEQLLPDFIWTALDFIIANVTASDGGVYTCTAENEEGSVNASVVVYVTPYFTTQLTDILTTNGTNETVSCSAEGFPPPDIQWVASIDNYTQFEENVFGSGSGSMESLMFEYLTDNEMLVFDPVVFGDEQFTYFCFATNDLGQVFSSLSVIGEFFLPIFNDQEQNSLLTCLNTRKTSNVHNFSVNGYRLATEYHVA